MGSKIARVIRFAKEPMKDGTRFIFWLDLSILLIVAGLVLARQWDFVLALFIGLIILNYFDRWRSRRHPGR
ncbi:MAG TPA: hypothetical protein GX702_10810 [Chloroflexi bacterium]|jgi:ABC-type proline/glycine betaine transport system permease subunit|nr:hypothetical protein [Chloroflexota bacterium]